MTNTQHPLAWSQAGSPIELSSEAEVWRVRRLNGSSKGGAPEVVYGADGIPLLLALETTPEEFAEAVDGRPGKYRLDALDGARNAVAGTPPAYHLIADGSGKPREAAALGSHSPDVVAAANNALVEALKDSSARMAQMVEATASIIHAADGAGIARRKPFFAPGLAASMGDGVANGATAATVAASAAPAPASASDEDGEPEMPWWRPVVEGVVPVVVQMAPMLLNYLVQARAARVQVETARATATPPRPSEATAAAAPAAPFVPRQEPVSTVVDVEADTPAASPTAEESQS